MPTYEYLCKTCGHRFDVWQSFSDDPLTVCPNCGAEIHRVLFPAGIVFKGSGFYKNDSRGSSASAIATESASSDSGDSSTAAKTETAPAAKASDAKASESKPAETKSSDSASTKTAS